MIQTEIEFPQPPIITIKMSYREACALTSILGSIGGWHENSLRQVVDPLYGALVETLCYQKHIPNGLSVGATVDGKLKMDDFPEYPPIEGI